MLKRKKIVKNSNDHTKYYTIGQLKKKKKKEWKTSRILPSYMVQFNIIYYPYTHCLYPDSSLLPDRFTVHGHCRLYEWKEKGNITVVFTTWVRWRCTLSKVKYRKIQSRLQAPALMVELDTYKCENKCIQQTHLQHKEHPLRRSTRASK